MVLAYPLADDCRAALRADRFARTRREADAAAGADMALVSEFLRPSAEEMTELAPLAERGREQGFVQIYEAAGGESVLGVTYWRRADSPLPALVRPPPAQPSATAEDHTDDLYFAKSRDRKRGRRRFSDPNQMDLFGAPEPD